MLFHASLSVTKRSQGASAMRTCAYDLRAKLLDLRTGRVHNYSCKREKEVAAQTFGCERHRPEDLCLAVENFEKRCDSQLFYRLIIAAQSELSPEQNFALFSDLFLQIARRYGVAGYWALHWKNGNPHVHSQLTMRHVQVGATGFTFGKKIKDLSPWASKSRQGITELRALIATVINKHLELAGAAERVDHRSYVERGIDQVPQIHEGPVVRHMRTKNVLLDIARSNDEILRLNQELAASSSTFSARPGTQNASDISTIVDAPPPKSSPDAPANTQDSHQLNTDTTADHPSHPNGNGAEPIEPFLRKATNASPESKATNLSPPKSKVAVEIAPSDPRVQTPGREHEETRKTGSAAVGRSKEKDLQILRSSIDDRKRRSRKTR